ncbi:MAG: hypothetical protein ACJ76H_02700 [Bacteriovoracaceae bacterium]
MTKALLALALLFSFSAWSQSSMRRCTLLPITDSVGGAIGFKVFEEIEHDLKKSNWCTYVSNSGLINVFSKYRENLPQYLKTKEVLSTVAEKLKVGSLVRVGIVNEVKGVEVQMDIYGENGEDLYFSEKTILNSDDIDVISQTVENWLDTYSKMIPYDATVTGILGDQITLDVGKGYPIQIGQKFLVRRLTAKKKHPLLKKIVDWETKVLAEGSVFNISDNQALGMIKVYKDDQKLMPGDWVRLEEFHGTEIKEEDVKKAEEEKLGTLGLLSVALFGSSSSVDTATPSGSNRWSGGLYGVDVRAEGWITRQYFAALELVRSLGNVSKSSGHPSKSNANTNNGSFKLTGGYKYLPIGFFYGPQIDLYAGYANKTYDVDYSATDGLGRQSFSGLLIGVGANIPINREFRFFTKADFLPFPTFKDEDNIYGNSPKSASSLDLELGMKYQYTVRMTLDASLESRSSKARFSNNFKEVSYKDNLLKLGATFNF